MAVGYAVFAAIYIHNHPPYKWPVVPPLASPARGPNAFDYYEEAYSLTCDTAETDYAYAVEVPAGETIHSQAELDRVAAENLPVVLKVRQGLGYPYTSNASRSFTNSFAYYLGHERALARMLAFVGRTNAKQRKWDEAMRDYLDTMQFGSQISRDVSLLGPMTGDACLSIGRRRTWDAVAHVSRDNAVLSAHRLARISASEISARDALQQEEWWTQACLMEAFKKPNWRALAGSAPGEYPASSSPSDISDFFKSQADRARVNAIKPETVMRNYTRFLDEEIRDAALPYPELAAMPPPKPPSDPLTSQMVFPIGSFCFRTVCNQALDRLLEIELALRAYQCDHGAYPSKLSALSPTYLAVVPTDPFTNGAPMHYVAKGSSYLLYSVGPDCGDDGGKPIRDTTRKGAAQYNVRSSDQTGDIVAGLNY